VRDVLELGHDEWKAVVKDRWTVVYLGFRKVLPGEVVERLVVQHVLEIQRLQERVSWSGRSWWA